MKTWKLLPALLLISACGGPAPHTESTASEQPVTDRKWALLALGKPPIILPGYSKIADIPITFQMHSATSRAWGYGGCGRYSARYVLQGDSVRFTDLTGDRGCSDLEDQFLRAVMAATHYQMTDAGLTLLGPGGPVASFGPAEDYPPNSPAIPLDADTPGNPVELPEDLK